MDAQTKWWLENTSAGRRVLARMPGLAIPSHVRRRICEEQDHQWFGDRCSRCGDERPSFAADELAVLLAPRPRLVRVVLAPRGANRVRVEALGPDEAASVWVGREQLAKRDDRRFRGRFR